MPPISKSLGSITAVKSSYNFLAKENLDNLTSGNPMHDSGIWKLVCWKMVWGLNVLNNVKSFIWHSCRDDVPVKKNLKNRQILPDDICNHCKQSPKSILHALWECPELSSIWDSLPAFSFRQTRTFPIFNDVVIIRKGKI